MTSTSISESDGPQDPSKALESDELVSANPFSINELFDKDPEDLSEEDVEKIVAELREKRTFFEAEDKEKRSNGGKKKIVSKEEAGQITLGDLGL